MNELDKFQEAFQSKVNSIALPEPLSAQLDALPKTPSPQIESYYLSGIDAELQTIKRSQGTEAFEKTRQAMLIQQVLNHSTAYFSKRYTVSIQEQYKKALERFLDTINQPSGWQAWPDDVFWKDYAIAREQIFPAGAQIVEAYSGFGIRQGIGGEDRWRFIKFLGKILGRTKGWYQIHTHLPNLSEFTPEGWDDCYVRLSEMLQKHKEIRGFIGGSWFYDPQLEEISPRLSYLAQVPLASGAERFHVCEDQTGNALSTSNTRLTLYQQGKYRPQAYLLVWSRGNLIKWSNSRI